MTPSTLKIALLVAPVLLLTGCLETTKPLQLTGGQPKPLSVTVVPVAEKSFSYFSARGGQAFFGLIGAAIEYAATADERKAGIEQLREVLSTPVDARIVIANKVAEAIKPCFKEIKQEQAIRAEILTYSQWKDRNASVIPNLASLKGQTDFVIEVGTQDTGVAVAVENEKRMAGIIYIKVYRVANGELVASIRDFSGSQFKALEPRAEPKPYQEGFDKIYSQLSLNVRQKICDLG